MALSFLSLALGLLLNISLVYSAADWSYSGATGPSNWATNYPLCDDSKQSPINIETGTATPASLGEFTFSGYDTAPTSMTLKNNGHTVQVDIDGTMTISGAGLTGPRKAAQFHWHWGSTNTQGSEHTIDGAKYPMELHIVHYDHQHTVTQAINMTDGLAVLGFFFEVQSADNPALATIVSGISNIPNKDDTYSMTPFAVQGMLPSNLRDFFRYQGSLTTPACYESVTWTVFNETIKISSTQLAAFRTAKFSDGSSQVDNFRPVQALNGRTVQFSTSSGATVQPVVLLMTLIAAATSVFQRV